MSSKIEFEQLSESMSYPKNQKANLISLHSDLIDYVVNNFQDDRAFKNTVIKVFNTITYAVLFNEHIPTKWRVKNLMKGLPEHSDDELRENLGSNYVDIKRISWDSLVPQDQKIEPVQSSDTEEGNLSQRCCAEDTDQEDILPEPTGFSDLEPIVDYENKECDRPPQVTQVEEVEDDDEDDFSVEVQSSKTTNRVLTKDEQTEVLTSEATPEEDLYLGGRRIPRVDFDKVYARGAVNGEDYCIYYSLPEIPEKQCDVSLTTDISLMNDSDFLRLYPNIEFCTRSLSLYRRIEGLELHPTLGVIIPISGYIKAQLIDNLVKYPTLPNLVRLGKKQGMEVFIDFEKMIEIDGELYQTSKVWKDIPECANLPMTKAIVHDYVIRRYLLERDVKHIDHNYKMYGDLDPYLTLFMPMTGYSKLGYRDLVGMARSCVQSRINYIRTRNPVLKKLRESGYID